MLLVLFLLAGLGGGGWWWYQSVWYVSTDDARISGTIVSVSAKIAGKVTEVLVKEGDRVQAGQVLVRIDPRDAAAQKAQAKAALELAEAKYQEALNGSRPLWAEISLALAEDDRETAGVLLERHGERLPRYDRINAAAQTGDLRAAQSDAFDTQSQQPADDPLHLQLTQNLLAFSDSLGGEAVNRGLGAIGEHERLARWRLAVTPRLAFDFALGEIKRSDHDTAVIRNTTDELYRSARLVWRRDETETRLTGEERVLTASDKNLSGHASYHPWLLEHERKIVNGLSLNSALGVQQPARETLPLRLFGMKDHAALGLRYRPTTRDQISLEHQWDRYFAVDRQALGNGRTWLAEASHALRLDTRDLLAGVFWSDHRFARQTLSDEQWEKYNFLTPVDPNTGLPVRPANFFLPDNFRFYGVRLSADTRFEREYTRAWRPYASIAKTWNSALGGGYDLSAGVAGSVFGADHLQFGWKLSRGGATVGGLVREIGLSYRIHY